MATGETEQMLLHWNNFHSSMAGSFHEFREREELVDVTLVARDGSVRAHRLLLSAGSPYLQRLLEASPCDHPVLILGDVGHRELLGVLEFMYCGEVRLAQADLGDFLQAAEMLQVKGLTGSEGKTEDDDDDGDGGDDDADASAATTTTNQNSPQKHSEEDDDSDNEERSKRRRKRVAQKRRRSENAAERDCGASASKDMRTGTSSTDDDSTGTNCRTEFLRLPEQSVELVDIDTDSDAEKGNAMQAVRHVSSQAHCCDITSSLDSTDGLQLIQRLRGYPQLVYANYIFNCQLYEGSYVYWVCQDNYRFNCRASIVTIHNRVINVYGAKHNHKNHEREVEDEMLKGNFRVLPLRRDMFLDVHSGKD